MNRGRPTLSVVIPARNQAQWLPSLLGSLRAQEVDGWVDTVVVDDGSTDGTAEVAEGLGSGLPGFRVLRTPATNTATATNAGVAASRGEAVVFVDGDDEVAPGYLAAVQEALAEHPFVATRIDAEALNPLWVRRTRPRAQRTGLSQEPERVWPLASGGTLAVRRDVLASVGGYDEAVLYAQDTDLCWRLAAAGVPLTFVPEAVLRYRFRTTARGAYRQARGYGRGGPLLELRYGRGRSWARIARRAARLVALPLLLPLCLTRRGRVANAYRAGHLIGYLEAALRPRRYFTAASVVPVP